MGFRESSLPAVTSAWAWMPGPAGPAPAFAMHGPIESPILFKHERQTPTGEKRLVVVGYVWQEDEECDFWDGWDL